MLALWLLLVLLGFVVAAQFNAASFEFEAAVFKWFKIALKWRRKQSK